jgi:hypothetical protein
MATETDEVIAVVSPRSLGPTSLFDVKETITSQSVQRFHSKDTDVRDAKSELRRLGFNVYDDASNETTVSIGGSAKLFKDVFGAKLKKETMETHPGEKVSFMGTGEDPEAQVLQAPGELANLIEGAVIARPPIYFAPSPIPPVEPIDPAAYQYLFVPNDVAVILRSARVHRMGVTGRNVVVGMLDTGHYRHPFFTWHGYRLLATLLAPGAADPGEDSSGHGTGESANIFANSPDCRLRPVKMGNDVVGAINTAMGSTPKPQILTNSWGYDVDRPGQSLPNWLKPLEAAVANAVASGVVVCFAAGNGHFAFPGSHPEVISVGGVHVNYPALSLEASSYASSFASSFYPGRKVPDICGLTGKRVVIGGDGKAPSLMLPVQAGANLDGIAPSTGSSSDGWGLFSGTSAACPQVAGVCALMLEKDPTLTPAALKQKLIDGARDVTQGQTAMGDTAVAGNDLATGAGLVDAKWAYLRTMGDVAATFLTAPREDQLAMVQSGSMPEVPKEFIEDLMETLRSR